MLKDIKFTGGFFDEEKQLELFKSGERLSILYGKNGSGKSTISKAVLKAIGKDADDIIQATLYTEDGSVFSDTQLVRVFNEDYINSHVKIRSDGLNTIVLLGELGDLEDKILDLELKLEAETKRKDEREEQVVIFTDRNSPKSPSYFKFKINLDLSEDGHWAEREKWINDGKRKASVTDGVIDTIISLNPSGSLSQLRKDYDEKLELLNQVRKNAAAKLHDTVKLNVNYDENELLALLAQKVESPTLNEREQYLIQLINDGKMDQINEMRIVFSKEKTTKCPFCFRDILREEKQSLIKSIEKVLSKEIDIHENKLKQCIISEITVDLSDYDILNSKKHRECQKLIEEINHEIFKIREIVLKKIHHPYTPILDFSCDLIEKLERYEIARKQLQEEVDAYNNAAKRITSLKLDLTNDNKAIAHYEVANLIDLWKEALENQKEANNALKESKDRIKDYNDQLNVLRSRKKNINIAVNLINKSLRYVFFSKNRLEIKVQAEKYVLYAHGKSVKPSNVSVGERNIIALCYFFTELLINQEAKDGYVKRIILFIDDPVSSFDFENKVGIMSLLKAKIADIIKSNEESQVMILTHDIQCLYDFQKIGDEVCEEYRNESNGQKKTAYSCKELKDKNIIQFSIKNRNEYSELLKIVYDYACGDTVGLDLTVGNSMRRVLEAFSTFMFKKGIANISYDEAILNQIGDTDYIEYFKNLMYRLVLNGDSHMEERALGLENMDYMTFLDEDERQRTAQEVLCFLYLLNAQHVLAHLTGKKDVKQNIQKWCSEIKGFCETTK